MVAVLAELEPRPLSRRSPRRGLLAAVDDYVAGPRVVPAIVMPTALPTAPAVRPLPRPATIRPVPRPAAERTVTPTMAQVFLWRRIAVIAFALAGLLAAAWAWSVLGGASLVVSEHRAATVTYTVRPGDSYWSIAQQVAPNEDPRAVAANLERARSGAPLVPGQTLVWSR